jgi:hypothetical protein
MFGIDKVATAIFKYRFLVVMNINTRHKMEQMKLIAIEANSIYKAFGKSIKSEISTN